MSERHTKQYVKTTVCWPDGKKTALSTVPKILEKIKLKSAS